MQKDKKAVALKGLKQFKGLLFFFHSKFHSSNRTRTTTIQTVFW